MSREVQRSLTLAAHLPRLAAQFARWGLPQRSLLFGPLSLGDDLLCTAVLREARLRNQPFAMFTNRPELFAGNTDPAKIIPIDNYFVKCVRSLGRRVVQPYYCQLDRHTPDRDLLPPRHIIAEMCRLAGLNGRISLRPYLFLGDEERARGVLHPRQIAIQSTGLASAIPYQNKEWGAPRFAAVAEALNRDWSLVQIGSASDPALPVQTDLRGKTSLREAAAILANSLVFVGVEGFLVHLARAVNCRSVVVMGGRALPAVFGYSANINLCTTPPCAGCGLRNTCPHDLACMTEITPTAVLAAIQDVIQDRETALRVDYADLP